MKSRAAIFGGIYFGLVFAAGFVLGTLRVLVLEPRFGVRAAELAEMPIMLVVIYFAARVVVARMPVNESPAPYAVVGLVALVLLLLFEATLVLGLRGLTFGEYLDSRDPLAFVAYLVSLLLFTAMPVLLAAQKIRRPG